jgi:hypothetical protein
VKNGFYCSTSGKVASLDCVSLFPDLGLGFVPTQEESTDYFLRKSAVSAPELPDATQAVGRLLSVKRGIPEVPDATQAVGTGLSA